MLQNASSLAIVAVDTEENEPIKNEVWWARRHFFGPSTAQLARSVPPEDELSVTAGSSSCGFPAMCSSSAGASSVALRLPTLGPSL